MTQSWWKGKMVRGNFQLEDRNTMVFVADVRLLPDLQLFEIQMDLWRVLLCIITMNFYEFVDNSHHCFPNYSARDFFAIHDVQN